MSQRLDNFSAPGSMLKQPKPAKAIVFRKVSNKPPKKIRAVNPHARHRKRDGQSKAFLALIVQLPCIIPGCSRKPIHPHHLKAGEAAKERGYGQRATDKHAVPLCAGHHLFDSDCVENYTKAEAELKWFAQRDVDILAISARLWISFKSGGGLEGLQNSLRKPEPHP